MSRIEWTEAEWGQLAAELLKTRPEFLRAERILVSIAPLQAAIDAVMPAARRRKVTQTSQYYPRLLQAYANMRATVPAAKLPAPVKAPTPPAPIKPIFWTVAEWLLVARRLLELRPNEPWLSSFAEAKLPASLLEEAMQALPAERRRRTTATGDFRPHLGPAFRTIAAEQTKWHTDLADKRADFKNNPEKYSPEKIAAAAPAPTPAPPAAPVEEPAVAATKPAMNPYEAAFSPIMGLLAGLAADLLEARLAPMIEARFARMEAMFEARLAGLSAPVAQPPAAPAAQAPAPTAPVAAPAAGEKPAPVKSFSHCAPKPPLVPGVMPDTAPTIAPARRHDDKPTGEPEKRRAFKIGVLGGMPQMVVDLRQEYPSIEFIHPGQFPTAKSFSLVRHADLVLGAIKFIDHVSDGRAAKEFKDRYHRVGGSASEIKRLIQGWISSGEILA